MMRFRRPTIVASVIVIAASALVAAGCGGRASPRVASVATTTTAPTQHGAVAFSHCMRSHGVANFPDFANAATVGGRVLKAAAQRLAEANPQRFTRAARTCNRLLPNSGPSGSQQTEQQTRAQLADALSFAKCMRRHGVSRFPDPQAVGGLTVAMVQAQGINVHSPAFLHVLQVCLPASHGLLTPAKVRSALNEAGH